MSTPSFDRDNGRETIVEVRDLRMSFGLKEVLHGISFEVGRGEIFGFIGPNGAGKTTTIRILSTLLVPSAGDLWVDGVHVVAEPELVRRRVGYMPDYVGVYPGLTVREYLEFFAGAFRLPRRRRRATRAAGCRRRRPARRSAVGFDPPLPAASAQR